MDLYAKIYYFYEKIEIKIFRLLLLFGFSAFITFSFLNHLFPKIPVFLFSIILMLEVFLEFKIAKMRPRVQVAETKNPLDSFTLSILGIFLTKNKTADIIKELLKSPQIVFMLEKSGISAKEIQFPEIDKKELADYALELVKTLKGKYVTTMDLFAAYILLTEDKTKLLFSKKLKKEEMVHILYWARTGFDTEENPKPVKVNFTGEGLAEGWVFGWTIETKKYMVDLTPQALSRKPMFLGREEELSQTIEALYKGTSAILVGEPGSGKESVIEALAYESFSGNLKGNLYHQKFFQLMVDAFLAGTTGQGDLQERLDLLIAEISHAGNVIVYIPNFEVILGGSTFAMDLSGALIPYLEKGMLRVVGTVTPGIYKKYVEPRNTLLDVFEIVKFSEPDKDLTLLMLFKKAFLLENKFNVSLTYQAVIASFEFASKYAKEKVLPGAAVSLLEDTAETVKLSGKKTVEEQDILTQVERKTNIPVGQPKAEEKKLLLNLENEIHKRLVDQEEAVSAISESLRRLRTGIEVSKKPVSFLFLGPTGVGKTEAAKALSAIYFKSESAMLRFDMSEYKGEEGIKRLLGSTPGEANEKGEIEKVYDNPFSLVLLDEFEKADPKILDLFLQVLDDGRLTDNKGKTISFANAIIIATSNAGSEFIREEIQKGLVIDKSFKTNLLDYLQKQGIFKPELLNRFDEIVAFKPLGEKEVVQIIQLMLVQVQKTLKDKDIEVNFDDKIIAKIVTEGFDKEFGARPLKRFIQDNIEDLIAQKMLKDEIKRGDKITVSVDSSNSISLVKI
ncbi:MAG: ATP-dependent Clp protease ATP-binding subunit [Patescibacteria group bacterium]|nr:ATP-dependent Clp protease ATP-binding subunit [Patescibacteria group bacterium]